MKRLTFLSIVLSIIVLACVSYANNVVEIDIKPGSDPNSINVTSGGVISVAILGSDVFDATTIDPTTVTFGPDFALEAHEKGHVEDVNDDGFTDLVFHFYTLETGIECGDISATLDGETFGGIPITDSDVVNPVECN